MCSNDQRSEDEDSMERSFTQSLNASVRSNGTSRKTLRSARSVSSLNSIYPHVDSSILETVTLEQRDKFTLYKVVVNSGDTNWVVYRRYRDFILLNKKLRRAFPHFRLTLPGKRFFRDNFNKEFIDRRQQGLEDFMRNVLSHRDLVQCVHVQKFFRLDNPPQPNECLEACYSYAQSLELSLADLRQKLRDQNAEVNSLKTDIARTKYQKSIDNDSSNDQRYQHMVEDATKALKDQLYIAQENERKAKDELKELKEEIKAERASVEAARHIDRKERELKLRDDMVTFHQAQQLVDRTVNELTNAASHLPPVKIETGIKTYEVKVDEGILKQVLALKMAIEQSRQEIQTIHRKALDMYRQEAEDLKAELERQVFQTEVRTREVNEVRSQFDQLQLDYQAGILRKDDSINNIRRNLAETQRYAIATEEKYFYSLVIGVKLNMAIRGNRIVNINRLNPMTLFERVRNHGIAIEHWPSWISRELATASTYGEDTQTMT